MEGSCTTGSHARPSGRNPVRRIAPTTGPSSWSARWRSVRWPTAAAGPYPRSFRTPTGGKPAAACSPTPSTTRTGRLRRITTWAGRMTRWCCRSSRASTTGSLALPRTTPSSSARPPRARAPRQVSRSCARSSRYGHSGKRHSSNPHHEPRVGESVDLLVMAKALLANLRVDRADRSIDVRAEGFGTLSDFAALVQEFDAVATKGEGEDDSEDSEARTRRARHGATPNSHAQRGPTGQPAGGSGQRQPTHTNPTRSSRRRLARPRGAIPLARRVRGLGVASYGDCEHGSNGDTALDRAGSTDRNGHGYGSSRIHNSRNSTGDPSDSRQRWPVRGSHSLPPETSSPLTQSRISPLIART